MKMCQPHWDKIRQAIKDRGLDHLGAKSGPEAAQNIVDQLNGEETPYDPLMDVNNMIFSRALQCGGLYLMTQKDDGTDYCPVCEALKYPPKGMTVEKAEEFWINGPADAALKFAREKGLVPNPQ